MFERSPLPVLRNGFLAELERAFAEAGEGAGKLGVLFIDLDGFATVNALFGQTIGDAVLVAVADRIQECLSSTDLFARVGGDQFAIMLAPLAPIDAASAFARHVAQVVARPVRIGQLSVLPTVSVGVETGPWAEESALAMFEGAQRAMKSVKRSHPFRTIQRPAVSAA